LFLLPQHKLTTLRIRYTFSISPSVSSAKGLKYVVEFQPGIITSFIHRCAQPEIIMCTDWVLHFIVMF
jgi:hypothetical protein